MRKLLRSDSRDSEFSDGIQFFVKLCGFGLLLVYTRFLSPTEFGVLALLYIAVRVVETVVVQGMTSAVSRAWMQHFERDERREIAALSTAFWYVLAASGLVFGIFAFLAGAASGMLFDDGQWASVVRWFAVAGALRATQNVPRQILRMRRGHLGASVLELADFVVAASLNIYFVVFAKMGLMGLAYAETIREAAFCVITVLCVRTHLRFTLRRSELVMLLRNGLPKVPRGLSYLTASASDRFFLAHFATITHLGLFAFAFRFAELLELGTRPLTKGLPAVHAMGRERTDHGRSLVGRFMTYYVALVSIVGLAIVVFTKPLLELVTPIDYYPVVEIVPLLVLALCCAGTYRVLLYGVRVQQGLSVVPRVMSIAAVVSLVCNFWWIPRHGLWGAAIAAICANATLLLVAAVLDRRHFGVRFESGRLARILATSAIAYFISVWATPDNVVGQIAAGLAVVLLYPALLGVFGFYTEDELERLRELVNHRISLRPEETATTAPPGESVPSVQHRDMPAAPKAAPRSAGTESSRSLQPR